MLGLLFRAMRLVLVNFLVYCVVFMAAWTCCVAITGSHAEMVTMWALLLSVDWTMLKCLVLFLDAL